MPNLPSYMSSTAWYSPATIAVMYVDIRSVAGKLHTDLPSPCGVGSGVGALETTFQPSGAVTVKVKTDLRSGCSNVVNTRRASGTSNWV